MHSNLIAANILLSGKIIPQTSLNAIFAGIICLTLFFNLTFSSSSFDSNIYLTLLPGGDICAEVDVPKRPTAYFSPQPENSV